MRHARIGLALAIAASPASAQEPPWPTHGWTRATPAERGLDPAPLARLDSAIQAGSYGNVDALVVVKDGYLVASARYPHDYRAISRGRRDELGCGWQACVDAKETNPYNYYEAEYHPYYRGRDVHTLQSVTKSIAATLIGIAIRRREIAGTDAKLLRFLGAYDLTRVDPRLGAATLDDVLTMRSGIAWHEVDRPLDTTNTTLLLERSTDWVQFTLDQPMDAAPGVKWAYSSGGSQLLSAVLAEATGRTADAYAEAHLFAPLGIRDYHWKTTPTGLPDTEGGLYLSAEDLAKIGLLYLEGEWEDEELLPEGWAQSATALRVERVLPNGWGYGYQWWRLDRGAVRVWAALGFGGQYLLILPDRDVLAVMTGWNVFGESAGNGLTALLDALVASGGSR